MERNIKTLFAYECNRQPALAALVERIDTLSEADIAVTPVKLPWMRNALLQLKRDRMAEKLAIDLESVIVDGVVSDDLGWMRVWIGPSMFISIGRTGLEIHPDQLIWLGFTGMWIDTIYADKVPPEVLRYTRSLAKVTRSEYYQAVRKLINSLTAPASVSAEAPNQAFRIYRP